MAGFQLTDFELAVLIAVALFIVLLLLTVGRRAQPAPILAAVAPAASAAPATTASTGEVAAVQAEVRAMESRLSEVEHGVNQMRTMLNALPTKDAVHQIAIEVAGLKGDLKVNNTVTTATANSVKRIEEWIMQLDARGSENELRGTSEGRRPAAHPTDAEQATGWPHRRRDARTRPRRLRPQQEP